MSTLVGLRDLYYALLTSDPIGGSATYEAPVRIAGLMEANVNPNVDSATLFGDDGPMESSSTMGQIDLELKVSDVALDVQAVVLGHTINAGVMISKATDVPPELAIGFRSIKSNGKYRYVWLTKGKFSEPEQKHETKNDKVNFQAPTIKGSFVKRDCDDAWKRTADEDAVGYQAATGTDWFTSVDGTADVTAPTVLGIVPAANAVGVAVAAAVVITMSEAVQRNSVTGLNLMVFKDADGVAVAGAITFNAGSTVITFTPTVALTALTAYRVVLTGVKDLAGNVLAATYVSKFTTA